MSYAIIGFGKIGQAIAKQFARKGIEVAVAGRRTAAELASTAQAIGPNIAPKSLDDALKADVIFLAVPFSSHRDVGEKLVDWRGKTLIDVTNAYGVNSDELSQLASSSVVAKAFRGAHFVKGFNHLAAPTLSQDPAVNGGRRVVFLASNHESGVETVTQLADRLGFAPVYLGSLEDGGRLVQANGSSWAQLIFQDLFKAS